MVEVKSIVQKRDLSKGTDLIRGTSTLIVSLLIVYDEIRQKLLTGNDTMTIQTPLIAYQLLSEVHWIYPTSQHHFTLGKSLLSA